MCLVINTELKRYTWTFSVIFVLWQSSIKYRAQQEGKVAEPFGLSLTGSRQH